LYKPQVSASKKAQLDQMMSKEKSPVREKAAEYKNYLDHVRVYNSTLGTRKKSALPSSKNTASLPNLTPVKNVGVRNNSVMRTENNLKL
jgi:hypothetical protein